MKKILAILMALTMVLSLAACAAPPLLPKSLLRKSPLLKNPLPRSPLLRSLLRRPSPSNWLASSPPATMVSPVRALPTARWKPKPSWRSTKAWRSW